MASLIYVRSVYPCRYHVKILEFFQNIHNHSDYSRDQLLYGLSFLGRNYEKLVELFAEQVDMFMVLNRQIRTFWEQIFL